jgi:hypothetical protein
VGALVVEERVSVSMAVVDSLWMNDEKLNPLSGTDALSATLD